MYTYAMHLWMVKSTCVRVMRTLLLFYNIDELHKILTHVELLVKRKSIFWFFNLMVVLLQRLLFACYFLQSKFFHSLAIHATTPSCGCLRYMHAHILYRCKIWIYIFDYAYSFLMWPKWKLERSNEQTEDNIRALTHSKHGIYFTSFHQPSTLWNFALQILWFMRLFPWRCCQN